MPPGGCGIRLDVNPSDLPCGHCQKCTKALNNWNAYAEEVDDVGPLFKPGCWFSNRDIKECQNPKIFEAVAVAESLELAGLRNL